MAYVPGSDTDVFISYSHADNENGWVTKFEVALHTRLRELLGEEPAVWRDPKLSGEQDFTQVIMDRLGRTGVLVIVVSNSCAKSDYCRSERKHFFDHVAGGVKIGTRYRVAKAIKLPTDENWHRTLVPRSTGFDFYYDHPERGPVEYVPGDDGFRAAIDNLAKGVEKILRDLRKGKPPIYVAEPAPEQAHPAWKRLRAELESVSFRLLPSFRLDGTLHPDLFDPDVILNEIEPAESTVHLLGSSFSEFAKLQLKMAHRCCKPAVVWVPPDSPLEQAQEDFINGLSGFPRLTLLRTTPYWQLAEIVINQLRPKPSVSPSRDHAVARIYLICDRKTEADAVAARRLRDQIVGQEQMEVFLPDVDRDPADLDDQQQKRLAECDGVLLYWGQARPEWFHENYVDLIKAERRLRAQSPFKSRAIAVDRPDDADTRHLSSSVPILQLTDPLLASIEPFLQPLRIARAASTAGGLP